MRCRLLLLSMSSAGSNLNSQLYDGKAMHVIWHYLLRANNRNTVPPALPEQRCIPKLRLCRLTHISVTVSLLISQCVLGMVLHGLLERSVTNFAACKVQSLSKDFGSLVIIGSMSKALQMMTMTFCIVIGAVHFGNC